MWYYPLFRYFSGLLERVLADLGAVVDNVIEGARRAGLGQDGVGPRECMKRFDEKAWRERKPPLPDMLLDIIINGEINYLVSASYEKNNYYST